MEFEIYLRERGLSDASIAGYAQDMKTFGQWFHDRNRDVLCPQNLTPIDIRDYRTWLLQGGRAPASINRHLAAIRIYGDWGLAQNEIESNPAAAVRGVRQQVHAPKWLDRLQQARLIREVEKDKILARSEPAKWTAVRNLAILMTLLHTGLRVGELANLMRDDIQLAPRSGKLTVIGKGTKERPIPLNAHVRAALGDWLALLCSIEIRPRVFLLTCRAVQSIVEEYGHRAEVPASPHILRHTFAKNLVDAGVPLDQVAMLLGHAKLETTRIYTIPGERDLERAVEKLEL